MKVQNTESQTVAQLKAALVSAQEAENREILFTLYGSKAEAIAETINKLPNVALTALQRPEVFNKLYSQKVN
jgi:hypothetical protein